MFNSRTNNKITTILAAAMGLFMFMDQIFPELQNTLQQINQQILTTLPHQYQGTAQTLLILISMTIATIVYTYNYTTSIQYAQDHAQNTEKK